jgi:UDP-N-acetylmuramoyl-tripeptide--D-alanyl-D-alanine ligase
MIPMTLADVAEVTGGSLSGHTMWHRVVTSVTIDSRLVEEGSLFVAIRGEHHDGHDFVEQAIAAGAVAAMVDRPGIENTVQVADVVRSLGLLGKAVFAQRRLVPGEFRVIGLTGSVGKTTTKDLLRRCCTLAGPTVAPPGSFNNHLGLPLTLTDLEVDTQFLVLEFGATHRSEIAELVRLVELDVAVELGVGVAHLGEFGSREAIASAKAELLQGLEPVGIAVLNAEDTRIWEMAEELMQPILSFGLTSGDVRAENIRTDDDGHLSLRLVGEGEDKEVHTALIGEHHAINVAAAFAAAIAAGIDGDLAAEALNDAGADSPRRMDLRVLDSGALLIDDSYNANPQSVAAALRATARLARAQGRNSIAVLGAMLELGPASQVLHTATGREVVRAGIGRLIAVGKEAAPLVDAALDEGMAQEHVVFAETIDGLAEILSDKTDEGDIILIKGSMGSGLWRVAQELGGESA